VVTALMVLTMLMVTTLVVVLMNAEPPATPVSKSAQRGVRIRVTGNRHGDT